VISYSKRTTTPNMAHLLTLAAFFFSTFSHGGFTSTMVSLCRRWACAMAHMHPTPLPRLSAPSWHDCGAPILDQIATSSKNRRGSALSRRAVGLERSPWSSGSRARIGLSEPEAPGFAQAIVRRRRSAASWVTMLQVDIRVARQADDRDVAQVHIRAWQVAYRGKIPDSLLDTLPMEARIEAWCHALADSSWPAKVVLVIEEKRRVVGFVRLCPSRDGDAGPDVGEIASLYLLPDFWGRGWGHALLDRAELTMRSAGYAAATLWVLDSNARARRFYEAAGWTPDGATRLDTRHTFPLHEIRYRRSLA
jgi:GNAT superfamily N-acetyltransferase